MTCRSAIAVSTIFAGALALPATAQQAEVTADLNLRAGPGTEYPVIETIPDGRKVRVYGCEDGYDWCDVGWRNARGWVFTDYLDYRHNGRWRPVSDWGSTVGLPLLAFSFGSYFDNHYRDSVYNNEVRGWASARGWDGRDGWERPRDLNAGGQDFRDAVDQFRGGNPADTPGSIRPRDWVSETGGAGMSTDTIDQIRGNMDIGGGSTGARVRN